METTYRGTKKVKDTKLQMLTTWFEELRISEDESFDSFYSKLNEVVCPQMSSIGFLISPLPRKHDRFWRPFMRVQRKLRTQSYRC